MRSLLVFAVTVSLSGLLGLAAGAQEKTPSLTPPIPVAKADKTPPPPPPPAANLVAATVNGDTISEMAVYRALRRVPVARHGEARPEVINFLVENLLIEQYLAKQIKVEDKEIAEKFKLVKDDVEKAKSTVEKVLQEMLLSEEELRAQITAQIRWDKFSDEQANEKNLKELFDNHHDMFDGSMVKARHILLMADAADAKANVEAKQKLLAIKKQIDDKVAEGVAKLAADMEKDAKDKARNKLLDEAFADVATKESGCPSKEDGGNLPFFPRAGDMVEPFAKAAFALKPYEISDVVTTKYGQHLILAQDRKQGKEIKYEDVKDEVRDVYVDRLRDALVEQLKGEAKIAINPPPK